MFLSFRNKTALFFFSHDDETLGIGKASRVSIYDKHLALFYVHVKIPSCALCIVPIPINEGCIKEKYDVPTGKPIILP